MLSSGRIEQPNLGNDSPMLFNESFQGKINEIP